MTMPAWWMMLFDDGENPVEYFGKKYGARRTHIEVPLEYPQAVAEKLEAAGFKVDRRKAVGKGIMFLGHAELRNQP